MQAYSCFTNIAGLPGTDKVHLLLRPEKSVFDLERRAAVRKLKRKRGILQDAKCPEFNSSKKGRLAKSLPSYLNFLTRATDVIGTQTICPRNPGALNLCKSVACCSSGKNAIRGHPSLVRNFLKYSLLISSSISLFFWFNSRSE